PVGETVGEVGTGAIRLGDGRGPGRALRGRFAQLAGNLADAVLHPRLAPLPCLAAEAVERRAAFALAAVTRQQFDVLDRQIEPVAARIFECDAIVRRIADLDQG